MQYLKPIRNVRSFLRRIRQVAGGEPTVELHDEPRTANLAPPWSEDEHYAEVAAAADEEHLSRFGGRS